MCNQILKIFTITLLTLFCANAYGQLIIKLENTSITSVNENYEYSVEFRVKVYKSDGRAAVAADVTSGFTVSYTISGGVTTEDYTAPNPMTVTFNPGIVQRVIGITLINDTVFEMDENLTVRLTAVSGNTGVILSTTQADLAKFVTILNDDKYIVKLENAGPTSVNEGASAQFRAKVYKPDGTTAAVAADITSGFNVDYTISGTDVNAGTDYTTPASSTISFAAGTVQQTLSIPILNDMVNERDETLIVTLSLPGSGIGNTDVILSTTSTDLAKSVTIVGDDQYIVKLENAGPTSVNEGASAQFRIKVYKSDGSAAVAADITSGFIVSYAISGDVTAGDYTAPTPPVTISFPINTVQQTLSIPILSDMEVEENETLTVTISAPTTGLGGSGVALSATQAELTKSVTIVDDDKYIVKLENTAITSVNEGASAQFIVKVYKPDGMNQAVAADMVPPFSVGFAISGGVTTGDYTPPQFLNFFVDRGSVEKILSIPIVNDMQFERDETLTVTLSLPDSGSGSIGSTDVTLSATSTDLRKSVTIVSGDKYIVKLENAGPTTVNEGASAQFRAKVYKPDGTTSAVVADIETAFAVSYTISGTDVIAGTDYTAPTPPLTINFATNTVEQMLSIPILNDMEVEGDETLTVTISAPGTGTGTGNTDVILSTTQADLRKSVTIVSGDKYIVKLENAGPTSVNENAADAARNAQFRIKVYKSDGTTAAVAADITSGFTVLYTISGTDVIAGTDYTAPTPPLAINFATNTVVQMLSIPILNDMDFERDETLTVTLSAPGTGISNTDVILSTTSTDLAKSVTIVSEDRYIVKLENTDITSVNENVADAARNADFRVKVYKPDGTTPAVAADIETAFTVSYTISGTDVIAGSDYTAPTPLTISFAANTVVQMLSIPIINDMDFERDETLTVTLSALGTGNTDVILSATSTDLAKSVTIVSEDRYIVKLERDAANERVDEGSTAQFTVKVYKPNGTTPAVTADIETPFTVSYTISGTDVIAGTDYTAPTPLTITFAVRTVEQVLSIPILNEGDIEVEETLTVEMTAVNDSPDVVISPTAADLTKSITIISQNKLIVSLVDASNDEGNINESMPVKINVQGLNITEAMPTANVTISLTVTDGTATSAGRFADYRVDGGSTSLPFSFIIPEANYTLPENQNVTVGNIKIIGDRIGEENETIKLFLSAPTLPASLITRGMQRTATFTITNDDASLSGLAVNFTTAATSQNEGNIDAPASGLSSLSVSGANLTQETQVFILAEPGDTNPVEVEDVSLKDIVSATVIPVTIPAGDYTTTPGDVSVVPTVFNLYVLGDTRYEGTVGENIKLSFLKPSENFFYSVGNITSTSGSAHTINTKLTDFTSLSFEIADNRNLNGNLENPNRRRRLTIQKSDFVNGTVLIDKNVQLATGDVGSYPTTVTMELKDNFLVFTIYVKNGDNNVNGGFTNLVIKGNTGVSDYASNTQATSMHTINEDDVIPTFTVKLETVTANVNEGDTDAKAQFKAVLYKGTSVAVVGDADLPAADYTITYKLSGTATAGVDYTTSTAVTMAVGEIEKAIDIPILNEGDKNEGDKLLTLEITDANIASVGVSLVKTENTQTVTIKNQDKLKVSIASISSDEGDTGTTTPVQLKVTGLNTASNPTNASVVITVTDKTATSSGDFPDYSITDEETEKFFTVIIPPADYTQEANQNINLSKISINGDTVFELDETFTIAISSPTPSDLITIEASPVDFTITNDEASLDGLAINFATATTSQDEGDANAAATGLSPLTVTGGTLANAGKVYILAEPGDTNPIEAVDILLKDIVSATVIPVDIPAVDYSDVANQTIQLPSANDLQIIGDARFEVDEQIKLTLLKPSENFFYSMGVTTVADTEQTIKTNLTDFTSLSLEILDSREQEHLLRKVRLNLSKGDLTNDKYVDKKIFLVNARDGNFDTSIKYVVENGFYTFKIKVTHSGYGAFTDLVIKGDTGTPTFTTTQATSIHTLTNDDGTAAPTFIVKLETVEATVNEGAEDPKAQFKVVLYKDGVQATVGDTALPTANYTVTYTYISTGAKVADNADYTAFTRVSMAGGEVEKNIDIPIVKDGKIEEDETLTLMLTGVSTTDVGLSANISEIRQTVTIKSHNKLTLAIEKVTDKSTGKIEGVTGSSPVKLKVSGLDLSDYSVPVTIQITATDGTATSTGVDADYSVIGGASGTPFTVTIPPSNYFTESSTQNLNIPQLVINGDLKVEGDETFTIALTSPNPSDLIDIREASVEYTIYNDDDTSLEGLNVNFKEAASSQEEGNGQVEITGLSTLLVSGKNLETETKVYILVEPGDVSPVKVEGATRDISYSTVLSVDIPVKDYTDVANQEVSIIPFLSPLQVLGDTTYEADETIKFSFLKPSENYFYSMGAFVDYDSQETIATPLSDFSSISMDVGQKSSPNYRNRITIKEQEFTEASNTRVTKTVYVNEQTTVIRPFTVTVTRSVESPITFTVRVLRSSFANVVIKGRTSVSDYTSNTQATSIHTLTNDDGDAPTYTVKLEKVTPDGGVNESEAYAKAQFKAVIYKGDAKATEADDASLLTTDIVVQYATSGTATSGMDYTNTLSKFTIPAGFVEQALDIVVNNDNVVEEDETLTVTLESMNAVSNVGLSVNREDVTKTVNIVNGTKLSISLEENSVLEGSTGSKTPVRLKVTGADLSGYTKPVAIQMTVTDQTAISTTDVADYRILNGMSGTPFNVFIPAKDYTQIANQSLLIDRIKVLSNDIDEESETFTIDLATSSQYGTGLIEILDPASNTFTITQNFTVDFAEATTSQQEGNCETGDTKCIDGVKLLQNAIPASGLSDLIVKGVDLKTPLDVYVLAEPGEENPVDAFINPTDRTLIRNKDVLKSPVIRVTLPARDYNIVANQRVPILASTDDLAVFRDNQIESDETIKLSLLKPSEYSFHSMGVRTEALSRVSINTNLKDFSLISIEIQDARERGTSIGKYLDLLLRNGRLNINKSDFTINRTYSKTFFLVDHDQGGYEVYVDYEVVNGLYNFGIRVNHHSSANIGFMNLFIKGENGDAVYTSTTPSSIHTVINDDGQTSTTTPVQIFTVKLEKITDTVNEDDTNATARFKAVLYKGEQKAFAGDAGLPTGNTNITYKIEGTAKALEDYNDPSPKTITIPAGGIEGELNILVVNDKLLENDETLTVTLESVQSNTDKITLSSASDLMQTVTIKSEDTYPYIAKIERVSAASIDESASEAKAIFNVKLYNSTTGAAALATDIIAPLTIYYAITGDLTANTDYTTPAFISITIEPGTIEKAIEIVIKDDMLLEEDETLTVTLTLIRENNLVGLSVIETERESSVTITSDDKLKIAALDQQFFEGNGEKREGVNIKVSGFNATGFENPIKLDLTFTNGTAILGANNDYTIPTGEASGVPISITIPSADYTQTANQIIRVAAITLIGDTVAEVDKTLSVTLSLSSSAPNVVTLEKATSTITINNDDSSLFVKLKSVNTKNINEAVTNAKAQFKVVVYKQDGTPAVAADITSPETIQYLISGDVTAGVDYTDTSEITIPSGVVEQALEIPILDDNDVEGEEKLDVKLISVQGSTLVGLSTNPSDNEKSATIISSDDKLIVTIEAAQSFTEGNEDSAPVKIKVMGANALGYSGNISIPITVTDGTAMLSGTNPDYFISGPATNGTFSFIIPPVDYTKTENQNVSLTPLLIKGDQIIEEEETFKIKLGANVGSLVMLGSVLESTVTIMDDDKLIVDVEGGSVTEENVDKGFPVQIKVTGADISAYTDPVTIDITISSGTATLGSDYTIQKDGVPLGSAYTFTIQPKDYTNAFNQILLVSDLDLTIKGDTAAEQSETITVTVSNPTPLSIVNLGSSPSGTITIVDEDLTALGLAPDYEYDNKDAVFTPLPSQILSLSGSDNELQIAGLSIDNKVQIYNRTGELVWKTENYPQGRGLYSSTNNYFTGVSNVNNSTLPTGTYFMVIENHLTTEVTASQHTIVIVE